MIGWATDDNYKTPLIEKAIEMAARNHPLAHDAIFHSDRGNNYRRVALRDLIPRLPQNGA